LTQTTEIVRADDGFKDGQRAVRDQVCGDCHAELVLRHFDGEGFVPCCAQNGLHKSRVDRADLMAEEVRQRLERNPQTANALAVQGSRVPLTTQAIRELDNDKLMARVPMTTTDRFGNSIEISKPLRLALAQLGRVYGLDPLWDLMIYEAKPYVTYDGRLRKLREAPDYHGHKVRPLSKAEKEEWGYEPADLVIQCDVDMGPHGIVTDWGIVRASEISEALTRANADPNKKRKPAPVAVHPQQIALKRAVSRASKQAVGIDLPTIIETRGRVIDVQEVRTSQPALSKGEEEAQARRRFWAVAKGSPPDGLGLSEDDVHQLLGVESVSKYPGGWDQALSDLTERAAADDADEADADDEIDPGDMGEGADLAEAANVQDVVEVATVEAQPEDAEAVEQALARNAALLEDARSIGVRGLGMLHAAARWQLAKIEEANVELGQRIRSRSSDLDQKNAAASGQIAAF
jgi:hypothetical protein